MTDARFSEPDGLEWGYFTSPAGMRVRFARAPCPRAARGAAVVLPGSREPAEKYFEVARNLHDRGLDAWIMDWPGQGGSQRFLQDPMKTHHRGHAEQVETLHAFARDIVDNPGGGPLLCVAHSMGAHTALWHLARHPAVFDAAILTAPMLRILTNPYPRPVADLILCAARAFGRMETYIPGGGPWREGRDTFENNPLTHDPERFRVQQEIYRNNPALRLGDHTYGWVWENRESAKALLRADVLGSITAPVLMGIAGADTVVDPEAARMAARWIPGCERVDIPGAKHEIWMERDDFRDPWLRAVGHFIDRRLGHGPRPGAGPKNERMAP